MPTTRQTRDAAVIVWEGEEGDVRTFTNTLNEVGDNIAVLLSPASAACRRSRRGTASRSTASGGPFAVTTGRWLRRGPARRGRRRGRDARRRLRVPALGRPGRSTSTGARTSGPPDELLRRGRRRRGADEIERGARRGAERKGWIMDTYLLRRAADVRIACAACTPIAPSRRDDARLRRPDEDDVRMSTAPRSKPASVVIVIDSSRRRRRGRGRRASSPARCSQQEVARARELLAAAPAKPGCRARSRCRRRRPRAAALSIDGPRLELVGERDDAEVVAERRAARAAAACIAVTPGDDADGRAPRSARRLVERLETAVAIAKTPGRPKTRRPRAPRRRELERLRARARSRRGCRSRAAPGRGAAARARGTVA